MQEIDFVTAFGRLLRDGALRDRYSLDRTSVVEIMGVYPQDRPLLLALDSFDLEAQAQVLLHKRFAALSKLIPQTLRTAGAGGWPIFASFARDVWPDREPTDWIDAKFFCSELKRIQALSPGCALELNRVRFATNDRRAQFRFVSAWLGSGRTKRGLQVFIRSGRSGWREFFFHFG